jgi:hypothetical protein
MKRSESASRPDKATLRVRRLTKEERECTPTRKRRSYASDILTVRLERIEKTLSRLGGMKAPKEPPKSYADAIRSKRTKTPKRAVAKALSSPLKPEARRVTVRIADEKEKKRVNELSAKEIVERIN